ncbi:MAG: T9SS type A sorting domain-containing protein, partial [Flavobacteriaceae bacterium]
TSLAVVQTATGIRSTLSVPTNTDAQGLLVYPNPLHAQLHLVYPSATPATYTVYDLTGKAHSTHHASG